MATRNSKGQFVKGNKARTIHKQETLRQKSKLTQLEELQLDIYLESLKQIQEKLINGELDSAELIRTNSMVAEMVTPKKQKGDKLKGKTNAKQRRQITDLKDLLGE